MLDQGLLSQVHFNVCMKALFLLCDSFHFRLSRIFIFFVTSQWVPNSFKCIDILKPLIACTFVETDVTYLFDSLKNP